MDLELRQLRCLVAIVDTGSLTDAAIELGVSQPAVSRTLLSLERVLGVRLLHRTSRNIAPTTAGVQVLARARQLLAEADDLVREATTGHTRVRIGHAWSALGRHTLEFQRRWATRYPDIELQLIRTNSSTGGLAEGLCDLAVVRTPPDERRFASAVVGQERRYCALAADDPWTQRRSIRLEEVRERTVAIDRRTGSTTTDLWPSGPGPTVEYTQDIDDWLAVIATGRCVGITPRAPSLSTGARASPSAPCATLPRSRCGASGAARTPTRPPTPPSPSLRTCTAGSSERPLPRQDPRQIPNPRTVGNQPEQHPWPGSPFGSKALAVTHTETHRGSRSGGPGQWRCWDGPSARGAKWLTVDCRDGELFQVRTGQSSGFPVLWGVRHAAGGCAPTGRRGAQGRDRVVLRPCGLHGTF